MPDHHHSHGRQVPTGFQPPSIKELNDLTAVHPGHPRRRWMREHALDLGVLQDQIPSPTGHQGNADQHNLGDDGRVAIGSIKTDQSYFWQKRKERQVGRDGVPRRGKFTTIVAIASPP